MKFLLLNSYHLSDMHIMLILSPNMECHSHHFVSLALLDFRLQLMRLLKHVPNFIHISDFIGFSDAQHLEELKPKLTVFKNILECILIHVLYKPQTLDLKVFEANSQNCIQVSGPQSSFLKITYIAYFLFRQLCN